MLETECDDLQNECLQEESSYHYLNCLSQIAAAGLEKVQQEEKWTAGQGRLLPEFQNFQELYQNKIAQQESLSKQLRKQHRKLRRKQLRRQNQNRPHQRLNVFFVICLL